MIKTIWYFLSRYPFLILPDHWYYRFMFAFTHVRLGFRPYWLNLKNPKSFNEKINWLKLHERFESGSLLADKVKVREYVANIIGEQYLIPLIGVFENADDIPFDQLPTGFALKANHGSGWNIICTDKSNLNWTATKRQLNKWLSYNSYYLSREWQYKSITPAVICEQLLEFEIKDYKIFCFDGEPAFIQVDYDRFSNHTRSFYDLQWNKLKFGINYPIHSDISPIPSTLPDMIRIAKLLAQDRTFLRVDLYEHNNQVFFGELTLYPGGGFEPFLTKSQDFEMGKFIQLPA